MLKYLNLIRYKNLLFLAYVQFVMQQMVLHPILQKYGFETDYNNIHFVILLVATLCIAAGGYVLNDYFDIKIDQINRPESQIVGISVSKPLAMIIYQVLTAVGTISGLLLAYMIQNLNVALIFIAVPGLLWFYSASYKRQFIVGNLIVSLLAALSILVVAFTEIALLEIEYGKLIFETLIPTDAFGWLGGFALFSFLLTWIREIIKDMEDEIGDREMECRTMPIKWGIKRSKFFVYFLILLTITLVLITQSIFIHFEGTFTLKYVFFVIILPLLVLVYFLITSKNKEDFHFASQLSKIIMFAGVFYGFIFNFLMAKTYNLVLFNLFVIK